MKIPFSQCFENRKDRVFVHFFRLKYEIAKFHEDSFRNAQFWSYLPYNDNLKTL